MAKATLIAGYGLSQQLMLANLDGISHEESLIPPPDGGNSINWIAGHLLASRNSILKLAGGEVYQGPDDVAPYERGSKGLQTGDDCKSIESLREGIVETGSQLLKLLRENPAEAYDQEIDVPNFPLKFDEPTLDAYLTLLLYHEGYHIGQLGMGRRVLGKESAIK